MRGDIEERISSGLGSSASQGLMEKEEPARQEGVEQCPGDIIKKILGEVEPRRERELKEENAGVQ